MASLTNYAKFDNIDTSDDEDAAAEVVATLSPLPKGTRTITVASYNLLAPVYVRPIDKRTGCVQPFAAFAWVPDAEIAWPTRSQRLREQLRTYASGAFPRRASNPPPRRCRSGRASWNWRVKIPIELPLASPELGRLNVQLWDQDIIKWNDVIGQSQLDLYRWLIKAYKENRSVSVFKEINDAYQRKKAEEMGPARRGSNSISAASRPTRRPPGS